MEFFVWCHLKVAIQQHAQIIISTTVKQLVLHMYTKQNRKNEKTEQIGKVENAITIQTRIGF